jgi:hypothetical protein
MTISLATDSSAGGSLPAPLAPNSDLTTGFAYTSSFALTQVTGANGAEGSGEHDDLVLAGAPAVWRGRIPAAGDQPRRLL